MGKLERFNNIYRLFVATAISAAATLVLDHLQKLIRERSLQWVVLLVLVALLLFVVDQIFEGLFEKSEKMREWIAGDEFIEGYWYDISIDRTKNQVHHGSLNRIWWEDGAFIVGGVEYDPHGTRVATFRSTTTAFAKGVLTFQYESHGESFNQVIEKGVDQIQFDNPPLSYTGFYFDFTGAVSFRINGSKVDKASLEKHNCFRDLQSKQSFIVEQIQETTRLLNLNA
jgi:hypothetical protein